MFRINYNLVNSNKKGEEFLFINFSDGKKISKTDVEIVVKENIKDSLKETDFKKIIYDDLNFTIYKNKNIKRQIIESYTIMKFAGLTSFIEFYEDFR